MQTNKNGKNRLEELKPVHMASLKDKRYRDCMWLKSCNSFSGIPPSDFGSLCAYL